MPALKPVTTRSALLTLLLGSELPSLTTRELVAAASVVGFTDPAVRVALSRMTSAGDVVRDADRRYRLSERLRERPRPQDRATRPAVHDWDGSWDIVVVTTAGRTAADRAELRSSLAELRLAELREGVWTRPANLDIDWPPAVEEVSDRFTGAAGAEPSDRAGPRWDHAGGAPTAGELLAATDTTDPVLRFTACATSGRHLLTDPVLPADLLPRDWPGEELRAGHVAYKKWINDMRRSLVDAG